MIEKEFPNLLLIGRCLKVLQRQNYIFLLLKEVRFKQDQDRLVKYLISETKI